VIVTVSVPHTLPPPVRVGVVAFGTLVISILLDATLVPQAVEHVAVIACVVDILMLGPVSVVDHVIVPPTQPDAVIVASWPSQHSFLSAVNSGTVGAGVVPTVTAAEATEVPHSVLHVAV
jgi:hypothetical protein